MPAVPIGLACDWRVLAEDAYLLVPEVQVGLNLQGGRLPRLVTLVGPGEGQGDLFAWGKNAGQPGTDVGPDQPDISIRWFG
ncbi:MAG: hypothetical protein Ct9H300mP16_16190 [Pseudomonadota bacterium]|nr:MAG: hypothetical protein Ct9H300mP16_16190 [Pseudomonadota bacterium]